MVSLGPYVHYVDICYQQLLIIKDVMFNIFYWSCPTISSVSEYEPRLRYVLSVHIMDTSAFCAVDSNGRLRDERLYGRKPNQNAYVERKISSGPLNSRCAATLMTAKRRGYAKKHCPPAIGCLLTIDRGSIVECGAI